MIDHLTEEDLDLQMVLHNMHASLEYSQLQTTAPFWDIPEAEGKCSQWTEL